MGAPGSWQDRNYDEGWDIACPELVFTRFVENREGKRGWYREWEAGPEEADGQSKAREIQNLLAGKAGSYWLGQLDGGPVAGGCFAVFPAGNSTVYYEKNRHYQPSPGELSRFALGIISGLIELAPHQNAFVAGLSPETVFLRRDKNRPTDYGAPLLTELRPAASLARRKRGSTDQYLLGRLLYLAAFPLKNVTEGARELMDGDPFWSKAGASVNESWRSLVKDLLAGRHDNTSLEELRKLIPHPSKPAPVIPVVVAACVVVALVAGILLSRWRKPPVIEPPPLPTNAPSSGSNITATPTNTNQPPPPPPCLLAADTVAQLRQLGSGPLPPEVVAAISGLPEKCIDDPAVFQNFSNVLALAWSKMPAGTFQWGNDQEATLIFKGQFEYPKTDFPGLDDSLPPNLQKEFQRRAEFNQAMDSMGRAWTNACAALLANQDLAGWKQALPAVGTRITRLACQEFLAALSDSHFTAPAEGSNWLAQYVPPPNYHLDDNFSSQWTNLDSTTKRALRTQLSTIIESDHSTGLSNWVSEVRDDFDTKTKAIAKQKMAERAIEADLAAQTNAWQSFVTEQFLSGTVSNEVAADTADLELLATNLPATLAGSETDLRSPLNSFLTERDQLAAGGYPAEEDRQQATNAVEKFAGIPAQIDALGSSGLVAMENDFLQHDPPDTLTTSNQLQMLGRLTRPPQDLAGFLGQMATIDADYATATNAFATADYAGFGSAVARWTDLERRQRGFTNLQQQEQAEAGQYEQFASSLAVTHLEAASNILTGISGTVTNKTGWQTSLQRYYALQVVVAPPPVPTTNAPAMNEPPLIGTTVVTNTPMVTNIPVATTPTETPTNPPVIAVSPVDSKTVGRLDELDQIADSQPFLKKNGKVKSGYLKDAIQQVRAAWGETPDPATPTEAVAALKTMNPALQNEIDSHTEAKARYIVVVAGNLAKVWQVDSDADVKKSLADMSAKIDAAFLQAPSVLQ